MTSSSERGVPHHLVGEVWPHNHPGREGTNYGSAVLSPSGAFPVRSYQTFHLTYTVGDFGLDDTGGIRVAFRFLGDWGALQTKDPTAPNYVTAHCPGGGTITLEFHPLGGERPWYKALTARLNGGYLKPGDQVVIVFGDTSGGSPGFLLQTFAESAFEFRVLTDLCAVGHFTPLPLSPSIEVVPGAPARWRAVLPSLRRPGERFALGIKAEDLWGNPTGDVSGTLTLLADKPVEGLPSTVALTPGERAVTLEGLSASEGPITIGVEKDGQKVATAGPLTIEDGAIATYWGDMHGQSGETVGINTAAEYFAFARDLAFLDAAAHQGNDFQINADFWGELNTLTARMNEPGRFVLVPGYEWSGNTAVGGDHNVYFTTEHRPIRRSSHALLTDRREVAADAHTTAELFAALATEDCVVAAHVGGRYADIALAHDPRIETAVEIHSAWGTFEWLLTDAFALGYRVGVVCNSDGHKGRPGASYPGAATFGAYGGLTCFLAPELTREAIFRCWRTRRHYGTTGCRTHLDVAWRDDGPSEIFDLDPDAYPDASSSQGGTAVMGQIVETAAANGIFDVKVAAHCGIDRVDVRNGAETVATVRPYGKEALGKRIRVLCEGAEYRGRGRQTLWRCRAHFKGCRILSLTPINRFNPERNLEQVGSDTVVWHAATTGNFVGFDVVLEERVDAEVAISSNLGDITVPLATLDADGARMEAGGLARALSVARRPLENTHYHLETTAEIALAEGRDNPLWVAVTLDDGNQAWSSPIYVKRTAG
ncbi:MAG: DUF3604 domain-containing protein [Devosia sp.]